MRAAYRIGVYGNAQSPQTSGMRSSVFCIEKTRHWRKIRSRMSTYSPAIRFSKFALLSPALYNIMVDEKREGGHCSLRHIVMRLAWNTYLRVKRSCNEPVLNGSVFLEAIMEILILRKLPYPDWPVPELFYQEGSSTVTTAQVKC